MTAESRNALFLEHQGLIQRTIKRNRRLLAALSLEYEDVAQDLAIRMMKAIEQFDPEKSKSMNIYLSFSLQYEIWGMKKRQKPQGLTQVNKGTRIEFVSLNQKRPDGSMYELPRWDNTSGFDVSELYKNEGSIAA